MASSTATWTLVVANAVGAALLPVSGDAVAHLPQPHQRLDIDVSQVAWPLPVVALQRWFGFQVPQSHQPQTAESPGNGGEGILQQARNVPEVEPLSGANTPSIRQRGWTAGAISHKQR